MAVYQALLQARQKFGPVLKSKINPHFKSRYADLQAVLDAVEGPLAECGLVLVQAVQQDATGVYLDSRIVHAESGEQIGSRYPLTPGKLNDPQALGGAVTYARRYAALALLGLAPEDDDGNAATRGPQAERKAEQKPRSEPTQPQQSAQQPAEKPRPMLSEVRKQTVARLLQLAPAVAKQAKTTAPAVTEAVLAQIKGASLDTIDKPQVIALRSLCDALEAGKPIGEVIPALAGPTRGKAVKRASEEQLARLEELRQECAIKPAQVAHDLRALGATSIEALTEQQAAVLIGRWEDEAARLAREAASIEVAH